MGAVDPSDIIPGEMKNDLTMDVRRISSTPISIHREVPGHHLCPGGPTCLVPNPCNVVLNRVITQVQMGRNLADTHPLCHILEDL